MSTHAIIGLRDENSTHRVLAIGCHFDGYPKAVGATLLRKYYDYGLVSRLINNGGIDSLADTTEVCDRQDAFDAGNADIMEFDCEEEFLRQTTRGPFRFAYLFKGGNWFFRKNKDRMRRLDRAVDAGEKYLDLKVRVFYDPKVTVPGEIKHVARTHGLGILTEGVRRITAL